MLDMEGEEGGGEEGEEIMNMERLSLKSFPKNFEKFKILNL